MQTLSDTIRVVNEKLSSAGIGLTVEMNSNKTGLMLNDTTGSTSHNIKFKDITSSTVTSPEVPGVSAVSADDGSGGTAVLTFSQSDLLNGMSFAFTTESETAVPLYNAATKTITFHIPSDIASKTTWTTDDDNVLSLMMSAELDFYFRNYGGAPANAPSMTGSASGLAAKAMADAASGGKTKIDASLAGSVEGVTHVPETVSVSNAKIASALGLETDTASSQVSGTSLHRQIISYATKLSDLNGGSGVNLTGGKIYIQDSSGATMTLTIDSKKHQTVGDVLNAINVMSGIKVTARINDNGDGIVLEEYAGGTQSFVVGDADSISTFAKTLGIAGTVAAAQKDPDGRLRINASQTHEIAVEATDTLDDIRKKINDLNVGYNATIVNDGSDTPYRLSISSKTTGAAGGFNIDLSAIGLTTETMSESKDALLAYGDANNSSGLILHSATNTFKEIVNGITLTVTGVSDSPVTVSSASSSTDVLTALKTFVENYNKFREELNTYTYFQVSETSGVQGNELWNSSVAKAFDKQVTDMLLKTVEGIPGIRSLADLGITIRKKLQRYGGKH
jgi:flagellar hook-associated protein 2